MTKEEKKKLEIAELAIRNLTKRIIELEEKVEEMWEERLRRRPC